MGATEDRGNPMGVSWLAIYASGYAKIGPGRLNLPH